MIILFHSDELNHRDYRQKKKWFEVKYFEYLEVLLCELNRFDCDDKPTVKLDFPLVLLFNDWLNGRLEVLIIAIDDCGDGVDGATTGSNSLLGVLIETKNWSICFF